METIVENYRNFIGTSLKRVDLSLHTANLTIELMSQLIRLCSNTREIGFDYSLFYRELDKLLPHLPRSLEHLRLISLGDWVSKNTGVFRKNVKALETYLMNEASENWPFPNFQTLTLDLCYKPTGDIFTKAIKGLLDSCLRLDVELVLLVGGKRISLDQFLRGQRNLSRSGVGYR